MKKILTLGLCLALGSSLLVMNSCKKIKNPAEQAEEVAQSAEDFSNDFKSVNDELNLVFDILNNNDNFQKKNGGGILSDWGIISYVDGDSVFTDGDGLTMTVNFNANFIDLAGRVLGTRCADGFNRSGQLVIFVSKPVTEAGCVVEISFDISKTSKPGIIEYADSTVQLLSGAVFRIDGILNLYKSDNGWLVSPESNTSSESKIEISTGIGPIIVSFSDSKHPDYPQRFDQNDVSRSFLSLNLLIEQFEGKDTPPVDDDSYRMSKDENNETTGINTNGQRYTVNISSPLVINAGCRQQGIETFTEGAVKLKNDDSNIEASIDFGDGTCDKIAKLTVSPGGINRTITLP